MVVPQPLGSIVSLCALLGLVGVPAGPPPAAACAECGPAPVLAPPAPAPLEARATPIATNGYGNGFVTQRYDHEGYAHTQNGMRSARIASGGGFQFAAFLDRDGSLVVAKRALPDGAWETHDTRLRLRRPHDYHGAPTLGLDPAGHVHVVWDQHNNPLRYIRSAAPYAITAWLAPDRLDGEREEMVSYPRFLTVGGHLHLHYREGHASAANLVLKRYEPANATWWTVKAPLLNGYQPPSGTPEGAYWTLEASPRDGSLHLVWAWNHRDADDTRDLSYAWSDAPAQAWRNVRGEPLPDPLLSAQRAAARLRSGPVFTPNDGNARMAFTPDGAAHRVVSYLASERSVQLQLLTLRDGKATFAPFAQATLPLANLQVSLLEDQGALYAVHQPNGHGPLLVGRSEAPYTAWGWRPVPLPTQASLTWDVDLARWEAERTLSLYLVERATMPYLDAAGLAADPGGWLAASLDGSAERMGPSTSRTLYSVDVPDLPGQFTGP